MHRPDSEDSTAAAFSARDEHALVAAISESWDSLDDVIDAAGPVRPLGELFVDAGRLAPDQVQSALARQRSQGGRIGDLLIDQGALSPSELETALHVQARIVKHQPAPAGPTRLGEILIRRGRMTRGQLAVAIEFQRAAGMRIGDVLVRLGYLSQRDIDIGLRIQKKLAALALATAMTSLLVGQHAGSGEATTTASAYAAVSSVSAAARPIPAFLRLVKHEQRPN